MSEGRSGGTVRSRETVDGKRVDVYRAICDCCTATGPAHVGSARGARRDAARSGWRCEKARIGRSMGQTHVWIVRCPEHLDAAAPPRL